EFPQTPSPHPDDVATSPDAAMPTPPHATSPQYPQPPAPRDPPAGLEPLPAHEPKVPAEREVTITEALAPPPAHPTEPVIPERSPADPSFGEPAFPEPPLPEPAADSRIPIDPLPTTGPDDVFGHSLEPVPKFGS